MPQSRPYQKDRDVSGSSDTNNVIGLVAAAFIFGTLLLIAIIGLIAVPLGVGGFITYRLYLVYFYSDRRQERKAREHTYELYRAVTRQAGTGPDEASFIDRVSARLALQDMPDELATTIEEAAAALYNAERFTTDITPPPAVLNSIEGARYRDYLAAQSAKVSNPASARIAEDVIVESVQALIGHLPALPRHDNAPFSVPITHFLRTPLNEVVERIIVPFFREEATSLGMFKDLRERLEFNMHEVSGVPYLPENRNDPKLVLPSSYKGEKVEYAYLNHTPLLGLFDVPVPFAIPAATRFEHHWIVSPPGGGKSTMLQCLLLDDFERVARNEASVIVIDSNRDLASSIVGLERFAAGGDLEDRLIFIDVEDVEYPVAINIFDTQTDDAELSPRDREVLYNSAVSMLTYIFDALLGAEMTSRQSTLFNFTIELLLALEEPTLDTLIDIMQPGGLAKYEQQIPTLSPDAQRFFELKFGAKEFVQTKSQVVDRLFAVKRIRALARIFSSPKTKLNLYEELAKGRVIVINAAKSVLQEDGVEIFTRFFLANILLAAEKRQLLPKSRRMDTYLYIDEAQDVIRRDERLPVVLDQARKLRLGCVIAHQRLGQMAPPVLNALMGSTAIKFVANLGDSSLGTLANTMNTTPEFLRRQPPFHFAVHIRGATDTAVSLAVPYVDFSRLPQMTEAARDDVRRTMRERYANEWREAPPPAEEETESDEEPDIDNPF